MLFLFGFLNYFMEFCGRYMYYTIPIMRKKVSALIIMFLAASAACVVMGEPQQHEGQRRSFLRGDVLEIDLREAGTLDKYLGPGEDRRVRCIRLSGVMNGDDAKFIKRICDRSKAVDENDRSVDNYLDLELERVRIVGGGSYSNRSEHDAISNSMFSGCRCLRYVSLPRDLRKIGNYAFNGCSNLEEVRFVGRGSVREIGDDAFENCYRLSRINLPEGLEEIGDECFKNDNNLRRIDLPSTLVKIGKEAFRDVPITEIRLPYNLTFLGANALKGTKIVSLYLPRGLKVENDAFGRIPKLKEIQVERGNRYYTVEDGVLYDATGEVLIYYPNDRSGGFSVPSGVTTLQNGCFAGCGSLTTVTFPQSLKTIGSSAFVDCSSLGNVIISEGVCSIGADAFSNCRKLTSATIDAQITTLEARTFENCNSLQSIVMPSSLVTIGEKAFNECKSLQNIEWGGSLTSIRKEAFRKCGFSSLEVPNSVSTIGENAFRDCKSMRSIILPSSLAVVEKELFRGCENLTQVKFPENLTTIGENAFRDCKGLPSIELPEGLTTIKNNAFRGTSLTELTLPSSMLQIGDKIVEKCKMQKIVCLAIAPPVLTKISEKKTPLYVNPSSVDAYKTAKPWKDFKNILPINE